MNWLVSDGEKTWSIAESEGGPNEEHLATDPAVFAFLDAMFHFTLDGAAEDWNHKCPRYTTPAQDGFLQDWSKEVVFLNPPYGRELGGWLAKSQDEASRGATVVALIPAITDADWWHDIVMPYARIHFFRGRVCWINRAGDRIPSPVPVVAAEFRPPVGPGEPPESE